ncbi:hypothetical protein SEA_DOTI_19 [Microbacterium phage DoTi]|nr:hypothetical protein SEA_DOTI_19 [Microbacterium phage DoTi]
MNEDTDPSREELLNMASEEFQELLNDPPPSPIIRNPQASSSRLFSQQQDLMNRMLNDQRVNPIPDTSFFENMEGRPRRKSRSNPHWVKIMGLFNPFSVHRAFKKQLDENQTMFDGGVEHILIPKHIAEAVAQFLQVLAEVGVPEEARTPLSTAELNSLLQQVNGYMRSNRPPAGEVQHYMGLAPGEMPRRVNEGIVTALSYLGMLPDAGN